MDLSSQKTSLDSRLLSVEELIRQRRKNIALEELSRLSEADFEQKPHELGVYLSLRAEGSRYKGEYRRAIEDWLRAGKLLANSPLNIHYGRVQLGLSRAYLGLGDLKNAEIRGYDALAAFRRVNDEPGVIESLNNLARIAFVRCDYRVAVSRLEDALALIKDDPVMAASLNANLSRLRIHTGQWEQAEAGLTEALEYDRKQNDEVPQAVNLLSLGYLHLRSRRFILAGRTFDKALEIIGRLELRREKVIHLEYAGELALERGDAYKAKAVLSTAYTKALLLAPESDLVSQSARLLAEAELALDNVEEALKYGQKALEVATKIGEKVEVALAKTVVARAFVAKNDCENGLDAIKSAIEILQDVGDPLETARTLLVLNEVLLGSSVAGRAETTENYDQARRLFAGLGLDYWVAETDFRAGMAACRSGDLATGFECLTRAEKTFNSLNENTKSRAVHKFLKTLSDEAVTRSVSQENEFKIFGNLITPTELSDLKTGHLDEILEILLRRTSGDRALIYSPDSEVSPVESTFALTPHQVKRFRERFGDLLGEEISRSKPTLLLDCRRDPFICELFAETQDTVASVIVVPFKLSGNATGYLYLDKLCRDNGLNPFNQAELNFAVGFSDIIAFKWAEIQKNKLLRDNLRLRAQLKESAAFPNIITQSSEMLEILAQVRQVVDSNISISIEGETGSGKDLLVRAIHYNSERRDKRFISVNCAALPETLLESELFGYRRGAFTGADRDKAGLFEEADGGTFFLDEIGDMPLNIQAKVLRVLEEKELVRLGETTPRQVDVRIVSATNRDLKTLMSSGQFRQDLYYRLSALTFRLPPLRERKEDIPLLVNHFLDGTGKEVSSELMRMLIGFNWPGNVRELENEIKKMVLLAGDNKVISHELVSSRLAAAGHSGRTEKAQEVDSSADIVFDESYSLYDYLAYHEKRFIMKALREKNGVKKHAAELLNIPESTLRLKIKQYDIDVKRLKSSR